MENIKWVQPEESKNIKYGLITDEEVKRDFDIAVKMIENGQTKFTIDPKPLNLSEIT
jgi:hypothetical protein